VRSRTTSRFWDAYAELPERIKRRARKAYELFEENPRHPSLRLKKVHADRPIYSVRITQDYCAVGVQKEDSIIWFWIGSHVDYDRLLDRL
jgi:hypothetical protein